MASETSVDLRTAKQVRAQLGDISEVTLWRRMNNPSLGFPQPVRILGRLYFVGDDIDAWILAQAEVSVPARPGPGPLPSDLEDLPGQ